MSEEEIKFISSEGVAEIKFAAPVYKWHVTIPKGGNFFINYQQDLTLWQRFCMRFIGWGVEKASMQK